MVGISLVSLVAALGGMAKGGGTIVLMGRALRHALAQPAIIHLGAAILATVVTWFAARDRLLRWSAGLLILCVIITIAGFAFSLLYRDDYLGGSCGPYDHPAGHLHAGFPYSWLDGGICIPPDASLSEYASSHPELTIWRVDFLATLVDLLFWFNIGTLVSSVVGWVLHRGKHKRSHSSSPTT